MTERAPIPVTIVGGYLGAGKTTLVNNLLRQANGRRLAVMVNEFGALPIDEDLIEAESDQVVSLAGGCVCCSYGEDLVSSMTMIASLIPSPDHILLEASGVGFPGAIAGTVSLLNGFTLDAVVVLADAETVRDRAQDPYVGSTVVQQLKQADIVLLNKVDLVEDAAATRLWLEREASDASVLETQHSAVPIDVVLGARGRDRSPPSIAAHHAGDYLALEYVLTGPLDPTVLAQSLCRPALGLLRAKGFVPGPDGEVLLQIFGTRYVLSEPETGPTPGIVCIGLKQRLNRAALDTLFADIGEKSAS